MVSLDGYGVERILVRKSLQRPPREMLRVERGTSFRGRLRVRSPRLAELVDLASLGAGAALTPQR